MKKQIRRALWPVPAGVWLTCAVVGAVGFETEAFAGSCEAEWHATQDVPGLNGSAFAALSWDSDGAGPAQERLIVGGSFTIAGDTNASNIASWDGTSWAPLGAGVNGEVFALVEFEGDVIAGGSFTIAGGTVVNFVARWDGSTWSAMPSPTIGMGSSVTGLAVYDGELIASGLFTEAGGVSANRVARWDGAQWLPLGTGMNQWVFTVTVHGGELIAGGQFTEAGGVSANRVARWDGSQWSAMSTGMNAWVTSFAMREGDLIAGGHFTSASGAPSNRVARWDQKAGSWQPMGDGFNDDVWSLGTYQGELFAGGAFRMPTGSPTIWNIARWDEQAGVWEATGGSTQGNVLVMAEHAGELIAGGNFLRLGGEPASFVARWDGAMWRSFGDGASGACCTLDGGECQYSYCPRIQALTEFEGDLIAGGAFDIVGPNGSTFDNIARLQGGDWHTMGSGVNGTVFDVTVYDDEVIAAGGIAEVPEPGVVIVHGIVRWTGAEWEPLGGGVDEPAVWGLTQFEGDLVACGAFFEAGGISAFNIARWDGSTWSAIGDGVPGWVYDVAVHDGQLFAATRHFSPSIGGRVWRWNGSQWDPVGDMDESVSVLAVYNGDLVATGDFSVVDEVQADHIARWDGTTWHALGSGLSGGAPLQTIFPEPHFRYVNSMMVDDGQLIVGGRFAEAGGVTVNHIARWDGAQWHALGGGTNERVTALTVHDGQLTAGGHFTTADGLVSAAMARWGCLGDLTGDGVIDEADHPLFCAVLGTAAGDDGFTGAADLNGDAVIDHLDLAIFLAEIGSCTGDVVTSATFQPPPDGVVDGADLAYLLGAWGGVPSCADFVTSATFVPPPDGSVDGADLAVLLGAWGTCR